MNSYKTTIWSAIIAGLTAITVALIQFHPWYKDEIKSTIEKCELKGSVVDEASNESVGRAEIYVVGRKEQYYSEQNGNFNISFKDSIKTIRIRVVKPNYIPFDKSYDLPANNVIIALIHQK